MPIAPASAHGPPGDDEPHAGARRVPDAVGAAPVDVVTSHRRTARYTTLPFLLTLTTRAEIHLSGSGFRWRRTSPPTNRDDYEAETPRNVKDFEQFGVALLNPWGIGP